jgi:hypothetical protein
MSARHGEMRPPARLEAQDEGHVTGCDPWDAVLPPRSHRFPRLLHPSCGSRLLLYMQARRRDCYLRHTSSRHAPSHSSAAAPATPVVAYPTNHLPHRLPHPSSLAPLAPLASPDSQALYRPVRQGSQSARLHGTPASIATLSPTSSPATPGPTRTTSPADSCPAPHSSVTIIVGPMWPCFQKCTSELGFSCGHETEN